MVCRPGAIARKNRSIAAFSARIQPVPDDEITYNTQNFAAKSALANGVSLPVSATSVVIIIRLFFKLAGAAGGHSNCQCSQSSCLFMP